MAIEEPLSAREWICLKMKYPDKQTGSSILTKYLDIFGCFQCGSQLFSPVEDWDHVFVLSISSSKTPKQMLWLWLKRGSLTSRYLAATLLERDHHAECFGHDVLVGHGSSWLDYCYLQSSLVSATRSREDGGSCEGVCVRHCPPTTRSLVRWTWWTVPRGGLHSVNAQVGDSGLLWLWRLRCNLPRIWVRRGFQQGVWCNPKHGQRCWPLVCTAILTSDPCSTSTRDVLLWHEARYTDGIKSSALQHLPICAVSCALSSGCASGPSEPVIAS